jgi:hypothetical protein
MYLMPRTSLVKIMDEEHINANARTPKLHRSKVMAIRKTIGKPEEQYVRAFGYLIDPTKVEGIQIIPFTESMEQTYQLLLSTRPNPVTEEWLGMCGETITARYFKDKGFTVQEAGSLKDEYTGKDLFVTDDPWNQVVQKIQAKSRAEDQLYVVGKNGGPIKLDTSFKFCMASLS